MRMDERLVEVARFFGCPLHVDALQVTADLGAPLQGVFIFGRFSVDLLKVPDAIRLTPLFFKIFESSHLALRSTMTCPIMRFFDDFTSPELDLFEIAAAAEGSDRRIT
ncbi:hypothetical protein Nepgr_030303 [Nepenthes gracilis]|uniref:Uncharacterized protein n=1 Tax=Nepenthes gracilis TaxID=150966 RepID=A0AAD3TEC4_NEPGR|nr:hypothetical protein Nepgr_030303 [Nepenthes gracilis]